MEIYELAKRMVDCAIAVHWHLGADPQDGIERFFL
jgi:hypothetical protein